MYELVPQLEVTANGAFEATAESGTRYGLARISPDSVIRGVPPKTAHPRAGMHRPGAIAIDWESPTPLTGPTPCS